MPLAVHPPNLVNHLRWATDGSQAVTHGMSEAMDNDVITEVGMKPLVQCIRRRVGIAAGMVSVPWEGKA